MCIAAWIWQDHPIYQFLLVLNRDEYYSRPTQPARWWGEDNQKILGGRDELAGGTWLGCTKNGRLAFVTNFREPNPPLKARSRGDLPVRFLQGEKGPLEFAEETAKEADEYSGFNLILADFCIKSMVYVSNRPKGEPATVLEVSPGLHVVSNAKLNTPWPKVERLARSLEETIDRNAGKELPLKDLVETVMQDSTKADRSCLPNTGVDPEKEFELSSIFIEVESKEGKYGTRSQTALSVKINGETNFYEKYIENGAWKDHDFQYHLDTLFR